MSSTSIFWRLLPFRVPRLFGRRADTDYEAILQQLSADISRIQTRLTQIRARQRRAAITFTAYALGTWAAYTLVCYALGELTWEPLSPDDDLDSLYSARTLFVWLPILASPIVILSTRRIFAWWYKRIETAEEAHLQALRKRQRTKIAEIKRATDFDHLRMLLDKYDEDRPRGPQQQQNQQRAGGAGHAPRQSLPVSLGPQAAGAAQQAQTQRPQSAGRGNAPRQSLPAQLQQQTPQQSNAVGRQQPTVQGPGTPAAAAAAAATASAVGSRPPGPAPPRTVLDKFADWMFGPDPSLGGGTGVSAAMQKYALICTRCFAHNGLAMPQEFDEIQYVCPKCGAFNSRRPSSVPVSTPAFFNRAAAPQTQQRSSQPSATGLASPPPPAVVEEAEEEQPGQDSDANEARAGRAGTENAKPAEDEGKAAKVDGLRQRKGGQDGGEAMDTD